MISLLRRVLFRGSNRSVIVKKNIIGSLIIKGIGIFISLLLVPMTLGYMNKEMYGIWLTISSIMTWLNFFDVGFTLGLKNKLAEALALEDYERGKYLVSTTYVMMIAIFIPLCLVLELLVPFVNWASFLNIASEYNGDIEKAMYALSAFFCLQMIVNVITAVISAFQKVALSSAFIVMGQALSLIAIFLLTKFCPPSLLALAFAISAMPIIVLAISSVFLYKHKFKCIAPSFKYFDFQYVKDLFNLGFKFFILQIQVVIFFQTTNILMSNIEGPVVVSEYNIAYKYLNVLEMCMAIIISPLWPAFTDAYVKKDFTWMKSIYKKMLQIAGIISLGLVVMVIFSPFVFNLWVGDQIKIRPIITICIAINLIVQTFNVVNVNIINGIGTIKLQTYITLIGLLGHIPLALFLGHYYGAIGVLLSMIMIRLFYSPFFFIQINKLFHNRATGIWIK